MSNATATKTSTKRPTAPGKAAAKTAKAKSPAPTTTKASATSQPPVAGVNKYTVRSSGGKFATVDLHTGKKVSKDFDNKVEATEDCTTRNAWGAAKRPTIITTPKVKQAKEEKLEDHADKKTARLATGAKTTAGGKRTRHAEGPQRGDPKLAAGDKSLRGATVRVTDGPMKGKTGTLAGFTLSQKKYPIWKVKPSSGEPFNQIAHRLEVTAPPAPTATA